MTNVNTVAQVLNLTPRRVQMLAALPGCPGKIGQGDYDLSQFTLWYVRYLQMELERRGSSVGPEPAELTAARLGLLRAQVEKITIENDVASGELVELDAVRARLTRRIMNCRSRMLAIPTSMALQLMNRSEAYCTARIAAAIEEAVAELKPTRTDPDYAGNESGSGVNAR